MPQLTAGSRESRLALVQTYQVQQALGLQFPDLVHSLKTYKTQGDRILDQPLSAIGDKGMFVRELEQALLAGEIDFAVHSMKDMPAEQPPGLVLLPFGVRENPSDVLVSRSGLTFNQLPAGAVVGTSSLRRQALLNNLRPDLAVAVVRGNVLTRLDKLDAGQYDAIVLASAGLTRLDLAHRITDTFSVETMVPACCQGILGVELREDSPWRSVFEALAPADVVVAWRAERHFLHVLNGGCRVPMGAYAARTADSGSNFRFLALVASPDGQRVLRADARFTPDTVEITVQAVADDLRAQGADEILAAVASR